VTPLEGQRQDPNSIFNHYKKLIALRNSYPALATGSLETLQESLPKEIMAYFRKTSGQEVLVVHNVGTAESTMDLPEGFENQLFALGKVKIDSGKLRLDANSSVVLLK
jgi:glycosidase